MAPPSASASPCGGAVTGPDELQTPCSYYLMTWGGAAPATTTKALAGAKAKAEEDDDFDLFGETTEAEKAKAKELAESKKAEAKQKKKEIVEKSSLVIEVKPGSAETDLDHVLELVRAIEMDGLSWNQASKKVPIAFGLFKLQVVCTIEDAKVNTNDLIERIEALGLDEEAAKKRREAEEGDDESDAEEGEEEEEDTYLVQSAEIVSFSKL